MNRLVDRMVNRARGATSGAIKPLITPYAPGVECLDGVMDINEETLATSPASSVARKPEALLQPAHDRQKSVAREVAKELHIASVKRDEKSSTPEAVQLQTSQFLSEEEVRTSIPVETKQNRSTVEPGLLPQTEPVLLQQKADNSSIAAQPLRRRRQPADSAPLRMDAQVSPQSPGQHAVVEQRTEIYISIGGIDLRSAPQPPAPRPVSAPSHLSLTDFLHPKARGQS